VQFGIISYDIHTEVNKSVLTQILYTPIYINLLLDANGNFSPFIWLWRYTYIKTDIPSPSSLPHEGGGWFYQDGTALRVLSCDIKSPHPPPKCGFLGTHNESPFLCRFAHHQPIKTKPTQPWQALPALFYPPPPPQFCSSHAPNKQIPFAPPTYAQWVGGQEWSYIYIWKSLLRGRIIVCKWF